MDYFVSYNIDSVVQTGKYVATSITYPTKIVHYYVKFIPEKVSFQEHNTTKGQVFKSDKLAVKTACLSSMKAKTNWYSEPEKDKLIIILTMCTIVYPFLDDAVVKIVVDITRSVFNKNQVCI